MTTQNLDWLLKSDPMTVEMLESLKEIKEKIS
jgi:hypothetical protein